jgi:hypothetical protein
MELSVSGTSGTSGSATSYCRGAVQGGAVHRWQYTSCSVQCEFVGWGGTGESQRHAGVCRGHKQDASTHKLCWIGTSALSSLIMHRP